MREPSKRHPYFLPSVALYALLLFTWSALRHAHYGSFAHDLGAYHQIFWNLGAHGSLWSPIEQMHQWSAHLEVGLLPVGLLYRLAPTPAWLFALQAASSAGTAVVMERFAARIIGDAQLAFLCALATALTPQLLFANIYDFHSITLCAFPMALVVLGIEMDAVVTVALGAVIALSLREQMGLALAGAAAAWVVRHGRRRAFYALALGAIGVGVCVAEVAWLIPSYAGGGTFRYAARYDRLGSSGGGALRFALAHPLTFLSLPFEGRRRLVYPLVLASGAALPVVVAIVKATRAAAAPILVLAPLLLVQLYSSSVPAFSIEFHYGAPVVPLVGAAAIVGVGALARRGRNLALGLAIAWLVVTLTHAIGAVGPMVFAEGGPLDVAFDSSPRAAALKRAVAIVPRDAHVSAQDSLTPHLVGNIQLWPDAEATADWIFLDGNVSACNATTDEIRAAANRLRTDPRSTVRVDEAGVLLVERSSREDRR